MWIVCDKCNRGYDDAKQWTICPHSPLGSPVNDLCPKCDTLRSVHGACRHQRDAERAAALVVGGGEVQTERRAGLTQLRGTPRDEDGAIDLTVEPRESDGFKDIRNVIIVVRAHARWLRTVDRNVDADAIDRLIEEYEKLVKENAE